MDEARPGSLPGQDTTLLPLSLTGATFPGGKIQEEWQILFSSQGTDVSCQCCGGQWPSCC